MLISVIVPVYNAEKYLDKSIGSVINQSYGNIEAILVNDGSTDGSKMICDKYALSDRRIKVISQKNSGPAAARNTGLHHAAGDFVFFLDADDYIERDAFEKLVSVYNLYQPDLVMTNFSKIENNGEIVKQRVSFHPDNKPFEGQIKVLSKTDIPYYVRNFFKYPSNHLISYCWTRLYKLSIIKKNNIYVHEDMHLFEDFVFNLEYLKYTKEIVFVNESLYTYSMHNEHISASMVILNSKSLLHDMDIFKREANSFFRGSMFNIEKEIYHALIHYLIIFIIRSCRQINKGNREMIYNEINKIINIPMVRYGLRCYSPSKNYSRILPWLMRLKLVDLIILFGKYRAYKRYGRLKSD